MTAWPLVPLKDVALIERTGVAPSDIENDTMYVGLEHIKSGGEIINVAAVNNGELASSKFRFTRKHVLYGKLRPYLGKIAMPDFDGICSTDILPILPQDKLDRSYLTHFFRQPSMVDYASSRSTGVNLPRLSPKALADFEIPLPPLHEQKRIAAILEQADELRRLRQRAIDKLNTLDQSVFYEMFVKSHSERWLTTSIEGVVLNARTGPFGSQLLHSEFVDEGIAVLGIDNVVSNKFVWAKPRFITPEKYKQLKRYTVQPGDVLITIMATCGRCAVVPKDVPIAINTKHICCLTPDSERVLPEFLKAAFLMHPSVLRQLGIEAKGAVMPGLNMGIVKSLELPLPPLRLQQQFVDRLIELEAQTEREQQASLKFGQLFSSLQQRAFRGEL